MSAPSLINTSDTKGNYSLIGVKFLLHKTAFYSTLLMSAEEQFKNQTHDGQNKR